jgi:ribonucleoside-diphosphate reductase alpha chain
LSYVHNILDGANLLEVNPFFEELAKAKGFYSEELMQQLATGTQLHTLEDIPDNIKRLFVTAHEISPEWHVRMQAAFQKHCDSSISKTINFANSAKVEQVDAIYNLACPDGIR